MAAEPKAATEEPKIDLFEDDDEFEEFEINQGKNTPFFPSFWFKSLAVSIQAMVSFV